MPTETQITFWETLTLGFSSDHFLASGSSHLHFASTPRKAARGLGSDDHLDISVSLIGECPPHWRSRWLSFPYWWVGPVVGHISILDSELRTTVNSRFIVSSLQHIITMLRDIRTWKPHSDRNLSGKKAEHSGKPEKLIPGRAVYRDANDSFRTWILSEHLSSVSYRFHLQTDSLIPVETWLLYRLNQHPPSLKFKEKEALLASIRKLILGSNHSFDSSWIDHYCRGMKVTDQCRLGHMPTPRAGDRGGPRRN